MIVRYGVIGAGGIASRRTIPEGIQPSDKCELVAVMDADAGRAKAVADTYGVAKCFTRVEELLDLPEVDAVYVASPNYLHKEHAMAAARAGKHVLVEKPIALNVPDAEAIIAACRQAGVKLMVGYMMRFHAHHQWLKQLVDSGGLGQVVYGRTQLTCWYPDMPGSWRQSFELGGGGAWMDMGSHCLDLLEWWLGKVRRISAFSRTLTFQYKVDDSTTVLLEFESGAQGVVEVNFNVPDDAAQNSLELRGTRGVVVADHTIGQSADGNMKALLFDQAGYHASQERHATGAQTVVVNPTNPYRAEVEHFAQCIASNREPLQNGEEALRNLRLIILAYEAARTGKVITL